MRAGRIGFVVASVVIIAGCGVTLPVSLGDKAYPEHSNDWPNEQSAHPSVNANGTIIAFASDASNLTPDDTDHVTDVFVRNQVTEHTELVSVGAADVSEFPSISDEGTKVAFVKNIPVPPPADYGMVAVRDLVNKTTATFHEGSAPELSGDGQYVFYQFNNAIHRRTLTNANAGDVPAPDGGCELESTTLSASYNGGRVAFSCGNPYGPGSTDQYAWVYQFSPARIFSVRVPGQVVDQTAISGDGKRVIFIGSNTDIGSHLYAWDVDNTAGPVVISTNGSLGISDWSNISISKNGAFVANSPSSGFSTKVNRLKLQGTGASITVAGAIDMDVLSNGLPAAGSSDQPSISADGQTVVFSSDKRLHERDYERPNDDDIYARTEPG